MPKDIQHTPLQNLYFKSNPESDPKTALLNRWKKMSNINGYKHIFTY